MQNITDVLNAVGESLLGNKLLKIKHLLGLTLCVISTGLSVSASPWDLDTTFGSGGKVIWSPNNNTQSLAGTGMALQADGKIVMVGGYSGIETSVFMVTRFNSDGSIDTTFGNNGSTTITFGGTGESASSVAVQPDGKIVAGGRMNLSSSGLDAAIARLDSNGSLDTTFDGDGKVTVNFTSSGGSHSDFLNVIKVSNDGKIVFAGQSTGSGTASYHQIIGRLNADGSLDTTFDGDGKLMNGNGSGSWEDLIIHPDGAITLTGDSSGQFSSTVSVRKYNNNGSQAWGWSRFIQPGCYMNLNGIAEQSDGKVVVVGSNLCKPVAIRINSDGTEDNTFNNTPLNFNGQTFAVAVQTDGKILAAVGFDSHYDDGLSLVRYNTDGSLDTGFGNAGIARVRVMNGHERASDIIIQPDGKILVGGSTSVTNTTGYRFAMVRYQGTSAVPVKTLFDYDGDGRADVSVFRPSENKWYILQSSNSMVAEKIFAIAGDVPVPADYDGDGKTDVAVFRPSAGDWWYLSSINSAQIFAHWGQTGDIPRPSDFDGDGKTDYVVYRPSNNVWYRFGTTGATSNLTFGLAGDNPLVGDFDGDGKSDEAIFRPSTGDWWYAASASGGQFLAVRWGQNGDIPAPADYDGDEKTDFAVYRPSTGVWYILRSIDQNYTILQFGIAEDKPVAADYDGDGKADIAVFRPSSGVWYLLQSTSGFGALQFGAAGDIPTENAFIP